MTKGRIEIDATYNIYVALPENEDFGKANLSTHKSQEINLAEKDK